MGEYEDGAGYVADSDAVGGSAVSDVGLEGDRIELVRGSETPARLRLAAYARSSSRRTSSRPTSM